MLHATDGILILMLPIFAKLGSLSIYTYGVFLMLGFFWACFFIWKHIRISKFGEEATFDIVFLSFGGSLIMGRLVYCFIHFNEFGLNILKYILANGYPGISSFGMILGGVLTLYWACYLRKIKFQEFSDYIVPSLFIFTTVVELGAFFAGTEPGIVWKGFRHPVALYKAALLAIGIYISLKIFFNVRKEKVMKGSALFFFFSLYSCTSIFFQSLKDKRLLITESPIEYWAFFILLLTSCFYFVYYFRVLIGKFFVSFINSKINYVKTVVKYVPHQAEKHHRGGTEKTHASR